MGTPNGHYVRCSCTKYCTQSTASEQRYKVVLSVLTLSFRVVSIGHPTKLVVSTLTTPQLRYTHPLKHQTTHNIIYLTTQSWHSTPSWGVYCGIARPNRGKVAHVQAPPCSCWGVLQLECSC